MNFFQEEIKKLKKKGLYRTLNVIESAQGPIVKSGGRDFLLFSSNNYLGLANHPELKKAAKEAIDKYGVGTGASRLISGNMALHKELEDEITKFKETEAALLFTSGYMVNVSVISALTDRDDVVIIDKLCHASIVDGCRLSKAKLQIYPHNDINALEKILKRNINKIKKLIVTEGVFSMQGSISSLPEILFLAKKYKALILLDDAHATGILGNKGRGTCEYFDIKDESIIQMGTFSKALGSLGGFIAGSKSIINYLRNKTRSFIYSTALPPAVLATSIKALEIIKNNPELRGELWKKVGCLKNKLKELGYNILNSPSQIIPIIIGDNEKVLKFSKFLYEKGIFIPAIRTPTVSKGTERLRVTIMSNHKEDDLNYLLNVLSDLKRVGLVL
ncbi:MAG: 8-amino-7-oxononanoate synthase [bacterium]|nr:8-amino-7-oxononanoate synthase [bacterium]